MVAVFEPDIHRITASDYETLPNIERTELIDGVIYDMSPESVVHANAVDAIYHRLRERHPARIVRQAGSVRLDDTSLVEPDVYVAVRLPDDGYPDAADVDLIVEVALNTWAKDSGPKLAVYARSGIATCWLVDPRPGGSLVRHGDPVDGAYRQVETVVLADGLASLPVVI